MEVLRKCYEVTCSLREYVELHLQEFSASEALESFMNSSMVACSLLCRPTLAGLGPPRTVCLGTDHLIFHGGGRKSEKKYRACLEWKKKKSNITNTSKKKYRAQKISKLAILYIERKIQFP